MLGYVIRPQRRTPREDEKFDIPPDIERRLTTWIDLEEVGADGFWLWFRAVLPLLPNPTDRSESGFRTTDPQAEHRRLVEYARDRARLSVICEQYARENHILARRVRVLDGALRTLELAGQKVEIATDLEAEEMADRYVPRSRRRTAAARPRESDGHEGESRPVDRKPGRRGGAA